MKPDLYTKALLTVIAIMLSVIALRPMVSPEATAQAQGSFAGLIPAGPYAFFDTRTGDLWDYTYHGENTAKQLDVWHYKMTRPGAPLTPVK